MDIQAEKIALMKLLLETDSEEIISQLKAIFKREDYDFYNDLPDHVKEDIEAGLEDIKNGDVYDHESVMREFKVKYGVKD